MQSQNLRPHLGKLCVLALALVFSPSPAFAGGGSTGPTTTQASSDDVESAPLVSSNNPSRGYGFELEFDVTQLEVVMRGIRGKGQMRMERTAEGQVRVQLSGSFRIRVDAAAVADGAVRIRYRGERDAAAMTQRRGKLLMIQR